MKQPASSRLQVSEIFRCVCARRVGAMQRPVKMASFGDKTAANGTCFSGVDRCDLHRWRLNVGS